MKVILSFLMLMVSYSVFAETELEVAAMRGDLSKAKQLIASGADVNAVDGETVLQNTPLFNAVKYENYEIASLLLEKGADPNKETLMGSVPLTYAIGDGSLSMVKKLVERGANIEHISDDGTNRTPLVWALLKKKEDIALYLIEKGAKTDVVWLHPLKENTSYTLMQTAEESGLKKVVQVLTR